MAASSKITRCNVNISNKIDYFKAIRESRIGESMASGFNLKLASRVEMLPEQQKDSEENLHKAVSQLIPLPSNHGEESKAEYQY